MSEHIIKQFNGHVESFDRNPPRRKLSVSEQIENMESHGIKFTIDNKDFAEQYLSNNTYFFKLKAYAKLYDKNPNHQYINLEFAYLRDLATIDCYLRKEIISISLDIEHYLKALLLRDFNASEEDGYQIIIDFMNLNPEYYQQQIENRLHGKPCSNLVQKYSGSFAIWNFVEIINFGDLKELFQFFYSRNVQNKQFKKSQKLSYLINPTRLLRNAAAHNNCLLQALKEPYVSDDKFNFNGNVSSFLGQSKEIGQKTLNTNMSKPLIHDFCVMLFLYYQIAPSNVANHTFARLKQLFEGRIIRHREYYSLNPTLCSAYQFISKVINFFYEKTE